MKAGPRRIPLLVLSILSTLSLIGQVAEDHSPWSVTLSGGISVPSGVFASEAEQMLPYSRGLSGNPLTGPAMEGGVEYELLPWLVGTLRANYARMPAEDLTEAELFPPSYHGGMGGGTSRRGYSQRQGEWTTLRTMGGLGIQSADGHFSFGLHVDAGAQWTHAPGVEVNEWGKTWVMGNFEYGTYSTRMVQPSVGVWSVVAGGGVDLGWSLGPHFALRVGGALYSSKIDFPYTLDATYDSQWNAGSNSAHSTVTHGAELQQKIASYLITLGLSYRFPSWN